MLGDRLNKEERRRPFAVVGAVNGLFGWGDLGERKELSKSAQFGLETNSGIFLTSSSSFRSCSTVLLFSWKSFSI